MLKPKLDPNFLLANIIVKLMAPSFQNTLTFKHKIINHGRVCFLKLDNLVSLLLLLIHCFLTQNMFFAMEIANQHNKKFNHRTAGMKTFFQPGIGASSNFNHEARVFTTMWPSNHGKHLERAYIKHVWLSKPLNISLC